MGVRACMHVYIRGHMCVHDAIIIIVTTAYRSAHSPCRYANRNER